MFLPPFPLLALLFSLPPFPQLALLFSLPLSLLWVRPLTLFGLLVQKLLVKRWVQAGSPVLQAELGLLALSQLVLMS
jgi:hypothetical protein